MKRLLFGFGLATGLAYGWRRLIGAEPQPEPTWENTDNDPEDSRSVEGDLIERTRETAAPEQEETPARESGARAPKDY